MKNILKRLFDSTHKKPNREMLLKFLWRAELDISTNGYGVIMIEDISVPSVKLNVEGVSYMQSIHWLEPLIKMCKRLKVTIVNKDEVLETIHAYIDEYGLYDFYRPGDDQRSRMPEDLLVTVMAVEACQEIGGRYISPKLIKHVRAYADTDAYLLTRRTEHKTYLQYYRDIVVLAEELGILDELRDELREKILAYRQADGSFLSEIATGRHTPWVYNDTHSAIKALQILGGAEDEVSGAQMWLDDNDNVVEAYKSYMGVKDHKVPTKEERIKDAIDHWDGMCFDRGLNQPPSNTVYLRALDQAWYVNRIYLFGGQEAIDKIFNI